MSPSDARSRPVERWEMARTWTFTLRRRVPGRSWAELSDQAQLVPAISRAQTCASSSEFANVSSSAS